jgi:geranylgeranyl diphosphate synthase type I
MALDAFLDEQAGRLAPLGDDAARLLAEARASVSGGKRFRAAFCYWGFHSVAGRADDSPDGSEDALVRACASLELLHASALVHDDYMDASETRRGRPATHRGFAAEHRRDGWRGDPEQYGASAAILVGDLLLSWSDELLRRCGLPLDRVVAALDVFDRCRSEVITGQFLDVSVQARGAADVDAAMTVLRYKSAKYSIESRSTSAPPSPAATSRTWAGSVRSGSRSARPSSCATTCSGSTAIRPRPASPRATT